MIEELRSVIESIQFSSNEEIKIREEEIISLKNENRSLIEANEANLANLNKTIENKFELNEKTLLAEYKKKESFYTNLNNNLTSKIEALNEKVKVLLAENYEQKEKNESLMSKNNNFSIKVKELENSNEELKLKMKNLMNLNQVLEEKEKKRKHENDQNMERIEALWKEQYDRVSFSLFFSYFFFSL